MPQLDASTFTSQLFWLVICFFTMLFIMSKFITPKIADILAQRQRKIDEYLNKAHETKQQAEEALERYHTALAEARQQAETELEETKRRLNEEITRRQEELEQRLQKKIVAGEKSIAERKEQALKDVRELSAGLAEELVSRLDLKQKISTNDIKSALQKAAND